MAKTSLQNLTELVGSTEKIAAEPVTKAQIAKPATNKDKLDALKGVEERLNKQFNTSNSLIRLGSRVGVKMPHIVTGIMSLDEEVFGVGGVPRGRVVEVFGPESSGKTTVTLEIIAAEQRNGGRVGRQ